MKLDLITAAEANTLIAGKHYLGPVQFPPRYCIATPDRTCVAIFSWPMAASFKVKFTSLELARLWRSDDSPHRTDHFLNRAVRKLKEYSMHIDCVFTYADPSQGHEGKVYLGSGFTQLNDQIRVTDQWRTPDGKILSSGMAYRELKTKSRKQIKMLRPDWTCIEGMPKLLFVRPLRMRLEEIKAVLEMPTPENRHKLFSKAYGGFRVAHYQEKFPAKKCAHCQRLFIAARSDAKTCSVRCRVALHRRRR